MNNSNRKYLASVIFVLSSVALLAQPEQSGNNDALNVATAIQSSIESKAGLSESAKHIRVTATDSHEVYLQGAVASSEEKSKVVEVAQPYVGDYQLRDELIVTSSTINSASTAKSSQVRIASRD